MPVLTLNRDLVSEVTCANDMLDVDVLDVSFLGEPDEPIRAVGDLSFLVNLRELFVRDHRIGTSAARLAALARLQVLDLGNNHVDDMTPLLALGQLQRLLLDGNRISEVPGDISQKLNKLQCLHLHNNRISSLHEIKALSGMTDLTEFSIKCTPVAQMEHHVLYIVYHIRSVNVLDGDHVNDDLRRVANNRFADADTARLTAQLRAEEHQKDVLQGKLKQRDAALTQATRDSVEVDYSRRRLENKQTILQESLKTRDNLLGEKTSALARELTTAHEQLFAVEQELAFQRIDQTLGMSSGSAPPLWGSPPPVGPSSLVSSSSSLGASFSSCIPSKMHSADTVLQQVAASEMFDNSLEGECEGETSRVSTSKSDQSESAQDADVLLTPPSKSRTEKMSLKSAGAAVRENNSKENRDLLITATKERAAALRGLWTAVRDGLHMAENEMNETRSLLQVKQAESTLIEAEMQNLHTSIQDLVEEEATLHSESAKDNQLNNSSDSQNDSSKSRLKTALAKVEQHTFLVQSIEVRSAKTGHEIKLVTNQLQQMQSESVPQQGPSVLESTSEHHRRVAMLALQLVELCGMERKLKEELDSARSDLLGSESAVENLEYEVISGTVEETSSLSGSFSKQSETHRQRCEQEGDLAGTGLKMSELRVSVHESLARLQQLEGQVNKYLMWGQEVEEEIDEVSVQLQRLEWIQCSSPATIKAVMKCSDADCADENDILNMSTSDQLLRTIATLKLQLQVQYSENPSHGFVSHDWESVPDDAKHAADSALGQQTARMSGVKQLEKRVALLEADKATAQAAVEVSKDELEAVKQWGQSSTPKRKGKVAAAVLVRLILNVSGVPRGDSDSEDDPVLSDVPSDDFSCDSGARLPSLALEHHIPAIQQSTSVGAMLGVAKEALMEWLGHAYRQGLEEGATTAMQLTGGATLLIPDKPLIQDGGTNTISPANKKGSVKLVVSPLHGAVGKKNKQPSVERTANKSSTTIAFVNSTGTAPAKRDSQLLSRLHSDPQNSRPFAQAAALSSSDKKQTLISGNESVGCERHSQKAAHVVADEIANAAITQTDMPVVSQVEETLTDVVYNSPLTIVQRMKMTEGVTLTPTTSVHEQMPAPSFCNIPRLSPAWAANKSQHVSHQPATLTLINLAQTNVPAQATHEMDLHSYPKEVLAQPDGEQMPSLQPSVISLADLAEDETMMTFLHSISGGPPDECKQEHDSTFAALLVSPKPQVEAVTLPVVHSAAIQPPELVTLSANGDNNGDFDTHREDLLDTQPFLNSLFGKYLSPEKERMLYHTDASITASNASDLHHATNGAADLLAQAYCEASTIVTSAHHTKALSPKKEYPKGLKWSIPTEHSINVRATPSKSADNKKAPSSLQSASKTTNRQPNSPANQHVVTPLPVKKDTKSASSTSVDVLKDASAGQPLDNSEAAVQLAATSNCTRSMVEAMLRGNMRGSVSTCVDEKPVQRGRELRSSPKTSQGKHSKASFIDVLDENMTQVSPRSQMLAERRKAKKDLAKRALGTSVATSNMVRSVQPQKPANLSIFKGANLAVFNSIKGTVSRQ